MTHAERALYDVLGGSRLVERMWNGRLPVRALVFIATAVAIPLHIFALWAEFVARAAAHVVEALWS